MNLRDPKAKAEGNWPALLLKDEERTFKVIRSEALERHLREKEETNG